MSPTLRFLIFELRFNCEKVAAMSFFRFFIVFLVFGAFHFPLSNSFFKKKASNSYFFRLWRRDPVFEQVLARRSFSLAKVLLLASASWCLQIPLEWRRHSCSVLLPRTYFHCLLQLAACKSYWGGCINVALRCCCTCSCMVFCNALLANTLG